MKKKMFIVSIAICFCLFVSCVATKKGSVSNPSEPAKMLSYEEAPKRDLSKEIRGTYIPPDDPADYVDRDRIHEFKMLVYNFKDTRKEQGISSNVIRKQHRQRQLQIIERCSKADLDDPTNILIKHEGDPSAAFVESCEYDTFFGPLDPKFNIRTSRHYRELK